MTTDVEAAPTWKGHLWAGLLGIIFIVSAVAKLAGLPGFERYVLDQTFAGTLTQAGILARLLITVELLVGLALLQRTWVHRVFIPLTGAILVGFSAFLVFLLAKGDTDSCHCLGELVAMSPAQSLLKNIVMIGITVMAYRHTKTWTSQVVWLPLAMIGVSAIIVFVGFPLPKDAAEQPTDPAKPSLFAPFTAFQHNGIPTQADLTKGTLLIGVVSLDCDHCKAVATDLANFRAELPPIYLLCLGDDILAMDFQFETGADFPYTLLDPTTFFKFIGTQPPRVYLLKDGKVVSHWEDNTFSIDAVKQAISELNASE